MNNPKNESDFKELVHGILNNANLPHSREVLVSGGKNDGTGYNPAWNLWADFTLSGDWKMIIECKFKPSMSAFAKGLGQCLLYKFIDRANHAVLCMPSWNESALYLLYRDVCRKHGVEFATEENLIPVLIKKRGRGYRPLSIAVVSPRRSTRRR